MGICGKLTNIIPEKKRKILKSPRNFEMKNRINYSILLNVNFTFIHFCFDDAATTIENLNKTEF